MNWKSYANTEYEGEVYGQKDVEFMKFAELPKHTAQLLDLGMGHPVGAARAIARPGLAAA